MQYSEPSTPATMDATNRRKSGRAVQKPVLYQQDPNLSIASSGSGKRKRGHDVGGDDVNDEEPLAEESSPDEEDSEPDEEELKEQRKRAARGKKTQSRPATKKAKTGGNGTVKLAMRPATNGIRRATKPKAARARKKIGGFDDDSLYGNNFALETVRCLSTDLVQPKYFPRTSPLRRLPPIG